MARISRPAQIALLALLVVPLAAGTSVAGTEEPATACHPVRRDRPVCPDDAAIEEASFVDPTARGRRPRAVTLERRVYVGPFATLDAARGPITVGPESNVQDNVEVVAGGRDGVEIGERVILAHGSSVRGPAVVGVGGRDVPEDPEREQNVFLSFGSRVDGAVLERNTGLSALARVGPGVTLRSGTIVLPGKDVTTQAEADDPALGKVRALTDADVAFNLAVLDVNVTFARESTRLYREDPSNVRGVNLDPGGEGFDPDRDLPVVGATLQAPDAEPQDCLGGEEVRDPRSRNRIIGSVCFADGYDDLRRSLGRRVSLRADEGEDFQVGTVEHMGDDVIFHALEEATLFVGNGVTYGDGVIVHGGGRPVLVAGDPEEETVVEDDVTLGDGAVVFRSLIGAGSTLGERAVVVGTELEPGSVVEDGQIYVNGALFGDVEWGP